MAVELVAGALLSSLLDALIGKLGSEEVCNLFGGNRCAVAKSIRDLNVTLVSANALLNDAEDKQVKDSNIKNWVDMLNDVLSEADNVVDEINTEALRRKIEGKSFLRKLAPASFSQFDKTLKPKIDTVIESLNLLLAQKGRLGLRPGVQSKQLIKIALGPLIGDPSDVLGRDEEKKGFMKLLISKNDNLGGNSKISVIPIVGMGGIGKTTLARLVYDDSEVKNHFEHKAWVTVSDDFDVFRLAKRVFKELVGKNSESEELGKLQDEMKSFLNGKKYLLVLDDVWNEDYNRWNSLKSYLSSGADGSKIIVTTRSEVVASKMGSVQSHRLTTMSDEDCWQLFSKHVFHNAEPDVFLEETGRAIVKKCRGLPLAVISLAGLLRSVSDPKEWEEILKSDVWDLHRRGNDNILPSLWLSYSYLPSHLKRCFAYCSIFPKDYEYKKKNIILLWMAEGLLQGENMKDVGEEYFKALISRSLLERSAKQESNAVMHDLVHDLATFVSGKGFCVRLGEGDNLDSLTSKTRHLLYEKKLPEPKDFEALSEAKCLRTMLALSYQLGFYKVNPNVLVNKFECLRVLSLLSYSIRKVPRSIGKLKHLRYLDLSCNEIKRLPDTICTLYNLQTLLLRGCDLLTELPSNMGSLVNLRHLDLCGTISLNRSISNKLVLNEKLSISKIKEFKEHSQYYSDGSFEIVVLENADAPKDVLDVEFGKTSGITDLFFMFKTRNSEKDRAILDVLKPDVSLKNLRIRGYVGKELSDWVGDSSFINMTHLSLSGCTECCHLNVAFLLSLESLSISKCPNLDFSGLPLPPSLHSLSIMDCKKVVEQRMQWGLTALKDLTFDCGNMDSFPEEGLLPTTLENLVIFDAPNLKGLNGKGFQHLTSLTSLEMILCPELECLPQQGLPASLKELRVLGCCVLLEPRLERETGEDWHIISHIPKISLSEY